MQGGKTIKQKKCRVCKTLFTPYSSLTKWCSPDCGVKLSKRILQRKADKIHREKKREFRENDKSIQVKAAQTAFNAYIRYRDRKEPCISCGAEADKPIKWAAGHFYTRGARADIRFNEDNCHKQCDFYCNCSLSGNLLEYRPNLIKKIGQKRFDALAEVKTIRYRAEDYRAIAKQYREKLKALKNELL